jgi:putative DNA primase/helicase
MTLDDIGARALKKADLLQAPAPTNGHAPRPTAADATTAPAGADPHRCNLTDLGNAERLVDAHGQDLHYVYPWQQWLDWDGRHWQQDASGEVTRKAKGVVRGIYDEAKDAAAAGNTKQADAIAKHATSSHAVARINAMIDLARSEDGIPCDPDAFDRDVWLLNAANGIVDLRTGALRPHDRSALLSKITPAKYDPDARCNIFLTFLDRIMGGNAELIDFLQRALGYSLTGDISERVLFILHGGGRNGKSTLLEAIRDVLGPDYTDRTPTDLLMTRRHEGIPNDLAALRGKRFVSASEVNEGRRLDEAKIKDVTGGDTISARFMRGEFFTFRPQFKLWLGTNHKPVIQGTDKAIWDRIRLIPFDVRIPDNEIDRGLGEKLREEAPGILAWMVDGCQLWQQRGLDAPTQVLAATDAYREEMDVLGRFLDDCCQLHESVVATSKDLYSTYSAWCDANGEKPVTQTALGRHLKERGFEQDRDTKGARTWRGIALVGVANATTLGGLS